MIRKPYPLPKISEVLQELEGVSYATALLVTGPIHFILTKIWGTDLPVGMERGAIVAKQRALLSNYKLVSTLLQSAFICNGIRSQLEYYAPRLDPDTQKVCTIITP